LRKLLLRASIPLVIVIFAGPELGIGLELFALLNLYGTELFILSLAVGVRMLPVWLVVHPIRNFAERIDPYFFVPRRSQIASCPGIVAHLMPGAVALYITAHYFVFRPNEL
jgi:hypothetical protein